MFYYGGILGNTRPRICVFDAATRSGILFLLHSSRPIYTHQTVRNFYPQKQFLNLQFPLTNTREVSFIQQRVPIHKYVIRDHHLKLIRWVRIPKTIAHAVEVAYFETNLRYILSYKEYSEPRADKDRRTFVKKN